MNPRHIAQINEAIFVLKHFIDLSAKLLPFLEELQLKRNPTVEDRNNKQKIIDVYRNYSFDTSTSQLLMNSNVLQLIKEGFETLTDEQKSSRRTKHSAVRRFLREHKRLMDDWNFINAN